MNTSLFTDSKLGKLVPIKVGQVADTAFVPDPLPLSWTFPARLWPLLVQAKEKLGTLNGIGQTLPDPQLLLHPLRRREAITSSRLEGTYATAQELLLFEIDQKNPTGQASDQTNAWREVANYNNALAKGATMLEEMPLCFRIIKDIHAELMKGVRGTQADSGEFRKHQVAIGSDRRYIPPPVPEMLESLDQLEKYINQEDAQHDPLVRSYIVHYQIEAIHPFADGNGRIGRVLLSLMIYKWCNHTLPWLYMSAFFERFKDEYITNLFRISTHGDLDTWIEYCLNGTIRQANDSIRKCERLRAIRDVMHAKAKAEPGTARTHHIIERLFSNPFIRIAELSKRQKVTYPTAKADVEHLAKLGILKRLEGAYPLAYYSPEIYAIAYEENDQEL